MGYSVISLGIGIIAVVIALVAFKMLANSRWIMGFVRGLSGFAALALAVILGLAAQDVMVYRSLLPEQTLMTLSFRRTSPKHFTVDIQETSGPLVSAAIEGEQWLLDVRMLYWTPLFRAVGFRTGYQMDSLKGRYFALDMQKKQVEPPVVLREQGHLVDVWTYIKDHEGLMPGISAAMASPGFVTAADGAIFEVVFSGTNLVAKPLNDAARDAEIAILKAAAAAEEPVLLQEINLTSDNGKPADTTAPAENAAPAEKAVP